MRDFSATGARRSGLNPRTTRPPRIGEVQLRQFRDFLDLASFHGAYTVRNMGWPERLALIHALV